MFPGGGGAAMFPGPFFDWFPMAQVEKAEKKANTALAEAAEKNAEEEEAAARADRVLDDTSLKALSEYRP